MTAAPARTLQLNTLPPQPAQLNTTDHNTTITNARRLLPDPPTPNSPLPPHEYHSRGQRGTLQYIEPKSTASHVVVTLTWFSTNFEVAERLSQPLQRAKMLIDNASASSKSDILYTGWQQNTTYFSGHLFCLCITNYIQKNIYILQTYPSHCTLPTHIAMSDTSNRRPRRLLGH